MSTEPDDFVRIVGTLTNFIENERVKSFNEGVDMILKSIKDWIRQQKVDPLTGDHVSAPDLLDDFIEQWVKIER